MLATFLVASGTPERIGAYSGCGGVNAPVLNANYEQQVLDLVNAERANVGAPPLKRATELENAARYHATDLGQDNYFDHNSYDRSGGSLVQVCGTSTRISGYYPGWNAWAENIAAGHATPNAVMYDPTYGWMNSAGHRANILSTSVWEIGIGYYEGGGTYYRYWAQDFGRRSGIYPLILNRDASTTNSTQVSIYIYGAWQEMRLRNDNGTWGAWQPFQASFNWTLNAIGGTRTVNAEVRSGGTTVATSDTIYLSYSAPVPSRVLLPLVIK